MASLLRVMVITDQGGWSIRSDRVGLEYVSLLPPPPAEFAAADLVLFIGPMTNLQRGLELAGAMSLALERGATFVFLYNGRFTEIDQRFMYELAPQLPSRQITGSVRSAASDPAPHPAFRTYITMHGQTDLQFLSLPDGVEVLARAVVAIQPYQTMPTAVRIGIADGSLYILPHQPSETPQLLLERLIEAVLEHREGRLVALPPFFEELRVPGEETVLQGIVAARDQLERLEHQRADLTRHKHLVGHFSGEQLVLRR